MSSQTQAPSQPEPQAPPPQPSTTTAADAKAYYGYLFEADKKPTKVLDALLRGIATYISESVGNTDEKNLTPDKLASFYKAVGGNYDSLFVEVPHPSISWIYASIGCQHTLQPTINDFSPPTVPALTQKGFVRWQSIEILLGPEEHVPFIQNAIRLFPIFNPLTGLPFPLPVPQEAFPLVPDVEIAKWHDKCAQELRQRASPSEDENRPHLPPRPKVQAGYTHVRPPRPRVEPDYFEPKSMRGPGGRPMAYHHVSSTGVRGTVPVPVRPGLSRSPSHRARQFLAPEDPAARAGRGRRASFPENSIPSPVDSPVPPPVHREDHTRRHSHPRHARRGSMSEDASSSEDGSPGTPIAERRRIRRSHVHERQGPTPPVAVRYSMAGEPTDQRRARERERGRDKEEEEEGRKRRSFPSIPIDITGKLSAPFLLGKRDRERDRERAKPRSSSRSGGSGGNVRWKDLDGDAVKELWRSTSGGSLEEDVGNGGRFRDDRKREYKRRDRDRDRSQRGSYEDEGRSSGQEGRHRHRERDREAVVNGRVPPPVPDGRSFRERDRDRERGDRRYVSPVRGVDGRRYPAHT
ncbi:hypothetical protein BKA65DRAFT_101558 [Rhexocercosporidium sp. MPI-PUGE-AT-0058]|nr:hypothetical protein BKA65DRAFT_101558 [Rhexocercosporidium sp. MPI-PUGE-AT-0058]